MDRRLQSGLKIRAATPPSIVATKLAAWHGRGNGDMLRSLDLHDILVLVDGDPSLSRKSPASRARFGATSAVSSRC